MAETCRWTETMQNRLRPAVASSLCRPAHGKAAWQVLLLAFFCILGYSAAIPLTALAAEDVRPFFYQANQYYEEGQYQQAIESYEAILRKGQASGNVFFNLGNAYYRAGQKGQALVNYLRARLWLPRDPDLRANLEHAEAELQLPEESTGLVTMLAAGIGNMVSLREMAWVVSMLLTIITLLLLIRLFRPGWKNHVQIPLTVAVVFFGVSVLGVTFSSMDASRPVGVVVAREAAARFEPSETGGTHFMLKEGNRAVIDTVREDWVLLRRSDGKKGWVKADQVEPIQVDLR